MPWCHFLHASSALDSLSFLVYGVIYSFPQIRKTFGSYFLKFFVCLFAFSISLLSFQYYCYMALFIFLIFFFFLHFGWLVLILFIFEGIKSSAVLNLLLILINEVFISRILFLPLGPPSVSLYIFFFSFEKLFS